MGLCGWYRKFVPNFASLATPLTDLMTTKRKFSLTDEAIKGIEELKQRLSEAQYTAMRVNRWWALCLYKYPKKDMNVRLLSSPRS